MLGYLRHDATDNRYHIINKNTDIPLHCGMCLEVRIGRQYTSTRIEMGAQWYLVGTGLCGGQLEGLRVRLA